MEGRKELVVTPPLPSSVPKSPSSVKEVLVISLPPKEGASLVRFSVDSRLPTQAFRTLAALPLAKKCIVVVTRGEESYEAHFPLNDPHIAFDVEGGEGDEIQLSVLVFDEGEQMIGSVHSELFRLTPDLPPLQLQVEVGGAPLVSTIPHQRRIEVEVVYKPAVAPTPVPVRILPVGSTPSDGSVPSGEGEGVPAEVPSTETPSPASSEVVFLLVEDFWKGGQQVVAFAPKEKRWVPLIVSSGITDLAVGEGGMLYYVERARLKRARFDTQSFALVDMEDLPMPKISSRVNGRAFEDIGKIAVFDQSTMLFLGTDPDGPADKRSLWKYTFTTGETVKFYDHNALVKDMRLSPLRDKVLLSTDYQNRSFRVEEVTLATKAVRTVFLPLGDSVSHRHVQYFPDGNHYAYVDTYAFGTRTTAGSEEKILFQLSASNRPEHLGLSLDGSTLLMATADNRIFSYAFSTNQAVELYRFPGDEYTFVADTEWYSR
jgi:hypothetical protein